MAEHYGLAAEVISDPPEQATVRVHRTASSRWPQVRRVRFAAYSDAAASGISRAEDCCNLRRGVSLASLELSRCEMSPSCFAHAVQAQRREASPGGRGERARSRRDHEVRFRRTPLSPCASVRAVLRGRTCAALLAIFRSRRYVANSISPRAASYDTSALSAPGRRDNSSRSVNSASPAPREVCALRISSPLRLAQPARPRPPHSRATPASPADARPLPRGARG